VATDATGNVYVTGYDGSLYGREAGGDVWVTKYDGGGRKMWAGQLGTAEEEFASGVATDGAGNVYIGGTTDGSLGGANRGKSDAWVAKYSTQP
jgi:hypothetical protein